MKEYTCGIGRPKNCLT